MSGTFTVGPFTTVEEICQVRSLTGEEDAYTESYIDWARSQLEEGIHSFVFTPNSTRPLFTGERPMYKPAHIINPNVGAMQEESFIIRNIPTKEDCVRISAIFHNEQDAWGTEFPHKMIILRGRYVSGMHNGEADPFTAFASYNGLPSVEFAWIEGNLYENY